MQQPTLTLALNERKPKQLTVYAFIRGFDGQGDWVNKTPVPGKPPNCMAHLALQGELTLLARVRGITEDYNFARHTPKPVKEVAVRGPRKEKGPKAPKNGLIGGFNPFAM
jgi:hypothetical protein